MSEPGPALTSPAVRLRPALAAFPALLAGLSLCFIFLTGCGKGPQTPEHVPSAVTAVRVEAKDTPIVLEFVGQTQGSHTVEIRARVDGFLEKRTYTEGSVVEKGQTMFIMDPKPFQARVSAAVGALAQQQARLRTADAELKRVKPLVEQNALSQKDLDDATGQQQAAAAAVVSAQAEVEQARLNLGYTTISAPLHGLSSYARVQEGSYVNPMNSLLTYVVRIDPMWVTFSVSENDMLRWMEETDTGKVRRPDEYLVEIVLADGSVYPNKGHITFADAEFNQQTGTFMLRATLPNPKGKLRPGQFVKARLIGLVRPNAITVPQRAVQQGAKGHFVWTVDKEGKAEPRPVTVGDWIGNEWFVAAGLRAGDTVVVEGGLTLAPGDPVKVKTWLPAGASGAPPRVAAPPPPAVHQGAPPGASPPPAK
jgi:membrane fusion protein (multidrug efflux system)